MSAAKILTGTLVSSFLSYKVYADILHLHLLEYAAGPTSGINAVGRVCSGPINRTKSSPDDSGMLQLKEHQLCRPSSGSNQSQFV